MVRAGEPSRPLVDVDLIYVCVDRGGAPVPWPASVRDRIRRFESVRPAEDAPVA
jgi:acyl-CoA thioesterase FadM